MTSLITLLRNKKNDLNPLPGLDGAIPNLLREASNLTDYIGFDSDVTFSSGDIVQSVANIEGADDWRYASGDSGLRFDGEKFIATAETQRLITESKSSAGQFIFVAYDQQDPRTDDINIIQFAAGDSSPTSAVPLNNTRLRILTTDILYWYAAEASGSPILIENDIIETYGTGIQIVGFEIVSQDVVNIYFNDFTTPAYTIDPNNAFLAANRLFLCFAGGDANYHMMGILSSLPSQAERVAISNNMKSLLGVTQSQAPFNVDSFSRDFTLFDSGAAFNQSTADVPISGIGYAGATVQARAVEQATGFKTDWQDIGVVNTAGIWDGTLSGIPDNTAPNYYNVQIRYKNLQSKTALSTHKFGVGLNVAIWAQSEGAGIIDPLKDNIPAQSVNVDNQFQCIINDLNSVRTPRREMIADDNKVTGAVVAMANAFQALAPTKLVCVTFQVQSGTSLEMLVDDDTSVNQNFRDWARDENIHNFSTADGQHISLAGFSWYSTNSVASEDFEKAFMPVLFGVLEDGTAITTPNYNHTYDTNQTIHIDHTFTELYGDYSKTKWMMCEPHAFFPTADLENAVTLATGSPQFKWIQMRNTNLSVRDMVQNIHGSFTDDLGLPSRAVKYGEFEGGNWVDLNHQADNDVDGFARRAEHWAVNFCHAAGYIDIAMPEFDNCTWTADYVEVWSSAGAITNLRVQRGLDPIGNGELHHTDVVGFEINGTPAQRAEIQSNGRVRVYPITGTFGSSDSLTFADGGGSGALLTQEDSEVDIHMNYPLVVQSAASGVLEGIELRADPTGLNFTNTL